MFISFLEFDWKFGERRNRSVWHFHNAVKHGDLSVVGEMLDAGVPIDIVDLYTFTALMISAYYNQTDVACFLLKKGANVNEESPRGRTALHLAAKFNSDDVVRLLLQRGASRNIQNCFGQTPLACAQSMNSTEAIRVLQEH